ncbi:MAG: hypothetical protein KF884_09820 [Fimbriimonadaceae bacterium]|nr:hypothetical protein [Fimbriimonadaceae bacterium]QYK57844.1 MAG: hypothetical protein KF884_09820 [Fimbriimonadaceae bacterium]
MTYTGGQTVVTGTDPPCTRTTPYETINGSRGGGGVTGQCIEPPPAQGYGTVTCFGEITATFTWTPSGPNDTEPPPPVVLVQQTSSALWSADSGSCANGLGDPAVGGDYGQSSSGTKWTAIQNPGQSFTVTCTPSASCSHSREGPSGLLAGSAAVSYIAEAFAIKLVVSGHRPGSDPPEFMIGQEARATLLRDIWFFDDTQTWSVTGGDPFSSYTVAPPSGDSALRFGYYNGSNTTITSCFFGKPGLGRFTCATYVGGPIRRWFLLFRDIQALKPLSEIHVSIGSTKQKVIDNQLKMGLFDAPPLPVIGTDYTADWFGIRWATNPLTPAEHVVGSDTGGWHWVQTVVPHRYRVNNGVYQHWSIDGILGLDTTYPYEPAPYGVPPGRFLCIGAYAIVGDAPNSRLEHPPFTMWHTSGENFRVYSMYVPPARPGFYAHWVALKEVSWYWNGRCEWDGQQWVGPTGAAAAWSYTGDFPWQPVWAVRHQASAGWSP